MYLSVHLFNLPLKDKFEEWKTTVDFVFNKLNN